MGIYECFFPLIKLVAHIPCNTDNMCLKNIYVRIKNEILNNFQVLEKKNTRKEVNVKVSYSE